MEFKVPLLGLRDSISTLYHALEELVHALALRFPHTLFLILASHLCLGIPNRLRSLDFSTKILWADCLSHTPGYVILSILLVIPLSWTPNILLSTLLNLFFYMWLEIMFHIHTK